MSASDSGNPQAIVQQLVELLRQEKVEDAAKLYSRLSEDIGFYLVQRMAKMPNLSRRVAKMFYIAKDFEKSALVFEEVGEFDKSAILYAKADNYGMAAEMYAKVEDFVNAAVMYEKHGNFATAAELFQQTGELGRAAANFEKAVNHFKAGKTYYELHKFDKAIELLQKVGPSDFNYLESVMMVNDILGKQGYRSIAIMKLAGVLEERGLSVETLDLALVLAENAAEEGDRQLAAQWLKRILEVKFPYKHAGDLLKKIESGTFANQQAATPQPAAAAVAATVEAIEEPEVIEDVEPMQESVTVLALEEEFETIRNAPLFQELNLQELKKFWTLVMPLDFGPGEIIIEQAVPGSGLYIVSNGKVKVTRVEDTTEQLLAELGAGAHLGEMSLLDDAPTSARVTATTNVDAFLMPKDAFQQLINSDDRLARKIYQAFAATLMGRLRDTNQQFKSFKEKKQTEMADLFGLKE